MAENSEIEISLRESYHKAKRAALAFSSLLALAALGQSDVSYSGFTLHLPILRAILAIAALYHVLLFRLEYGAVVRRNTAFSLRGRKIGVNETFEEAHRIIANASALVGVAAERFEVAKNATLKADLPPFVLAALEDTFRPYSIPDEILSGAPEDVLLGIQNLVAGQNRAIEDANRIVKSSLERHLTEQNTRIAEGLDAELEQMRNAISEIGSAKQTLEGLVADVTKLSKEIVREQRTIIQAFDRGAVYGLFSLALALWAASDWLADRCLMPWNMLCLS